MIQFGRINMLSTIPEILERVRSGAEHTKLIIHAVLQNLHEHISASDGFGFSEAYLVCYPQYFITQNDHAIFIYCYRHGYFDQYANLIEGCGRFQSGLKFHYSFDYKDMSRACGILIGIFKEPLESIEEEPTVIAYKFVSTEAMLKADKEGKDVANFEKGKKAVTDYHFRK